MQKLKYREYTIFWHRFGVISVWHRELGQEMHYRPSNPKDGVPVIWPSIEEAMLDIDATYQRPS